MPKRAERFFTDDIYAGKRAAAVPGAVVGSTGVLNDNTDVDASPADGDLLRYNATSGEWEEWTPDHGALAGLTDDDHAQYALLLGRSGGQTLIGGTASGNSLTLNSTGHATKGYVLLGSGGGLVGVNVATPASNLHVANTGTADPRGIMSSQHSTNTTAARLHLRKSSGTPTTPTVVVTGDILGRVRFSGYDGSNYLQMAGIQVGASGTVAATRVPTYMAFSTATDATPSVLTERMRITSAGDVGIGTSAPQYPLHINAATNPAFAFQRSDSAIPNLNMYSFGTSGGNITYGSRFGMYNGGFQFYTDSSPTNTTDNLTQVMNITNTGLVGIMQDPPIAQLDVNQASTTAAIPTLLLRQGDVSEPFLHFSTTIGTGNGLEAVGAKTLTPTHFVKVKLTGGLIRYMQVGTIA